MAGASNLFDFQKKTFDALLQGQSVILQAPTGAGKTRAALYPFLYHLAEPDPLAFPRRCVYSAPMRVLVNQFGSPEKHGRHVPHLILVATQVIEVGLDITCEALGTEVAPAASFIQRAGRCARFADEQGDVYVYDVPPGKDGKPNYAPYNKGMAELCCRTRDDLRGRDGGNGIVLDFCGEQQVIDAVHREADRRLLDDMRTEERQIWEDMIRGMALSDASVRAGLIRRVDSRTLLVHDDPQQLGNPFACRGFSLWQGTLQGKSEELWDRADELDLEWALRRPKEGERDDEEDLHAPLYFFLIVRAVRLADSKSQKT